MKTKFSMLLLVAIFPLSNSLVVLADKATIDGFLYDHSTIVGLDNGKLLVRVSSGADQMVDLSSVSEMSVDNAPNFNAAEAAMNSKDWSKAAQEYANAIRRMDNKPFQLLCKARAIAANDNAGKFPEALKDWIDVIKASPTKSMFAIKPAKLPDPSSQLLGESASIINNSLHDPKLQSAAAQKEIKTLLLDIYNQAKDRAAALAKELGDGAAQAEPAVVASSGTSPNPGTSASSSVNSQPLGVGPPSVASNDATSDVVVHEVSDLISAQKYAQAVDRADQALENADGDSAAALFMAKAQALEAQKKLPEAVLAYLRVGINYPRDSHAMDALASAARLERSLQKENSAVKIDGEINARKQAAQSQ